MYFGTNERAKLNEKIFNKRAVLAALASKIDKPIKKLSDQEVLDIFETQVEQFAIDMEGNDVPNAAIIERGYTGGLAEDIDMKKEKKKPVADQILPVFIYADGTINIPSYQYEGMDYGMKYGVILPWTMTTIRSLVFLLIMQEKHRVWVLR